MFHARVRERRGHHAELGAWRGTTLALTQRVRETVRPAARPAGWGPAAVLALLTTLAIFIFYFLPYPIRHARLPSGFDAAWYVWRATYVGLSGIGPVGTASRPGHAVLSALLGSVSGQSQLQMSVVFSQLLPALLALVVGALAVAVTGRGRGVWLATVAATGAVLGTTRLVGENLANLLNVLLEVGAVLVLIYAATRRRAMWGAVALLVAAGLAHWVFLAVFGVVVAAAVVLSLLVAPSVDEPRSLEIREEARSLVVVGLWTAALVGFLIMVVLRTPFRTFEIFQNPHEYAPKFITDLARLWPAGIVACAGLFVLLHLARQPLDEEGAARRSFSSRMLLAWAVASGAGVFAALITLKVDRFPLPPHRFLGLLVAVPGMVAAGAALWWAGTRVGESVSRTRRPALGMTAGALVVLAAVAALAVPSVMRWYRYPILLSPGGLREAETASQYVGQLPKGSPFVFVVDAYGPAVVYEAALREREIRMALPPDRQEDLHLFVGSPSDLLAGRRTLFLPDFNPVNAPYWKDVSAILPGHPPVLVLQSMGGYEFTQALSLGASLIGPRVALLQGPPPVRPLSEGALPNGVPSTPVAVLRAAALLALLSVAGVGWTRSIVDDAARPEVVISLVPVVGSGALLLGGFVAAELGVRLHGAGGIGTFVVVSVAGLAWSALTSVRRAR
jgi:hypothetical protein